MEFCANSPSICANSRPALCCISVTHAPWKNEQEDPMYLVFPRSYAKAHECHDYIRNLAGFVISRQKSQRPAKCTQRRRAKHNTVHLRIRNCKGHIRYSPQRGRKKLAQCVSAGKREETEIKPRKGRHSYAVGQTGSPYPK